MNLPSLDLICLGAALSMTGCLVDKQLGDVDTDTDASGTTGTDTATSPGSASNSTSNGSVSTSDGPNTSTTAGSPGTDGTDATGTAGEPSECAQWSPPPFDCEEAGPASVSVYMEGGGFGTLPNLDDEPCTVQSVQSTDPTTDLVTLACNDTYAFEITTSDPHLDLPISGGENVLVTAVESFENAITGLSSFVIRTPEGDLLIARINELDLTPDISVDPVVFNATPSGCPGFDGAVLCDDADEAILVQRIAVEFGNGIAPTVVFPGHHAMVQAGDGEAAVIVNWAGQIVCWDETCAGDDAGPFDQLDLIIVAPPG
jgi:hypothetical protein